MNPVNQKYWLRLEREAAELVASRFSVEYIPNPEQFGYMDGVLKKGGKFSHLVEIKVTDLKPDFFRRQSFFRLNGAKVRRGWIESFKHGLPFIVVAYCGGVGVFVWRLSCGAGIPEFIPEFKKEMRPVKAGRKKVLKEIARLQTKHSFYFPCK